MNPITLIDGYKLDHRRQYPEGTEKVYSNFTARGSRIKDQKDVVFFGLQYFLAKYLMEEFNSGFFDDQKEFVTSEYSKRINSYVGPNNIGTKHIRDLHNLGYLPLEFRAFPEGTSVPLGVPMMTFENTHPDFFWLVNYIETLLSSVLWMPCTSATSAKRLRQLLQDYATKTGANKEFINWQGHDFSFRGMPGPEAAALSGAGHLIFFTGTDTIPAIDLIEQYYHSATDYLIGGSVPATEHSVMCAGGKQGELDTIKRLLKLYPEGVLSVVSDTWDLWKVITEILPKLKKEIFARNGKLVIRPDSGDPVQIICGQPLATSAAAQAGVIELLWNVFGGTVNEKGLKVLDSHIGCIYGDSITYDRAEAILRGLHTKGFASDNIVFGVGSYTYQYTTRDTYNFAVKATWAQINGQGYDLFKDPVTDDGMKKSSTGRLAVLYNDYGLPTLKPRATIAEEQKSLLEPIWKNGEFIRRDSFDEIRKRAMMWVNTGAERIKI